MPINPKLKEHLQSQTMDEAYRQKLISILEDAPADVQNNWMSQQDYTRQVNAFKAEKADWKVKNDEFYAKSNAAIDAWKTEVQKATDEKTSALARIAELEAAGGPARTPDQEDAIAKEIKRLEGTISGLNDKLANAVTPDKLNEAYQNAVGFLGDQILTINEISAAHQEKFGRRFTKSDQEELIKFANERSKEKGVRIPLDEAYQMKNADEIKKQERQLIEKEVEERLKSQMVPNGSGPGGPGPTGKGPLEVRIDQERIRASGGDGDKGFATWQEAAAAAAGELVKEGKY